ncbi:MAG: c-type cytochrome [Sphingomicrobium sp.]
MGPSGLALIAAAATFGVSVAAAQTATPPPQQAAQPPFANPPYKNLKVFPATITRGQLLSNMKFFAQSLGVRCTYCHVGEEGKPLATFDFASDAKEKKLIARKMLAMVHRINAEDFRVTDFAKVKVTCFTCHRGATKPATEVPAGAVLVPPPPGATPPQVPGAPAPPKKPERGLG